MTGLEKCFYCRWKTNGTHLVTWFANGGPRPRRRDDDYFCNFNSARTTCVAALQPDAHCGPDNKNFEARGKR